MRFRLLVVLIGVCTFAKAAEKPKVEFKEFACDRGSERIYACCGGQRWEDDLPLRSGGIE